MNWLLYSLIFATVTAHAQQQPRIGLALEGGGALGFAHIGVLKWLEEHRIPVHRIAGTSMGALVGALYASGETPAEIEAITREIDWEDVLSGQIPFSDLSFRRKQDRAAYPNRLQFGIDQGLALPSGLNSGHDVGLILDRYFLPYYGLESFDDLPIPFRCVATNLNTGKPKVFDSGSLPRALRATMSLPAVFSPVRLDDQVYTDGAVVNNLPVDVAKDMGADIVIAVHLDVGRPDEKTFDTLLGVAARSIAIMVAANEFRSMQAADILLNARVSDYTSMDFEKHAAIMPKGYAAAEEKAALLKRLALNEEDWREHLAARAARKRTEVPVPTSVSVESENPQIVNAVRRELSAFAGIPVNPERIGAALSHLHGYGTFSSLNYGIVKRDGEYELLIRASERRHAPIVNLGVTIDGVDPSELRFGMGARFTLLNAGAFRAEWRTDAFFGPSRGLVTEYFRPLYPASRWFIAPRAYAQNTLTDLYSDERRIAQYDRGRLGFGLDVGRLLGRSAELRFGQEYARLTSGLRIGTPFVPDSERNAAITSLRYQYLGQDDIVVPRSGSAVRAVAQYITSREFGGAFPRVELRLAHYRPISKLGSLFGAASGGTAFGSDGLGLQSFFLKGPMRLGAYGRNELIGNQYFHFQAGYLRQITTLNSFFGDALYGLGYYEAGKVYGSPASPVLAHNASLAIAVKTVIGPVFAGASVGAGWRNRWWFGVGPVF